jgi:hypothetical protein
MTSAGLLTVRALFNAGRIENIAVDLQRPPVTRLFYGQIPDAVVKTIPYLYTLCAHAQRAVAQAAVAAAMGEPRRPVDDGELWVEMLHEDFWRLLLDWPVALGLPPAQEAFVAWRAARHIHSRVAETQKLLETVHHLGRQCLEKLSSGNPPETPGPLRLAPEQWLAYWQGTVDHPPANRRPASVEAAFRSRLHEADRAAAALAAGLPYPISGAGEGGWGVGQTLTARGILTHAVHVVDERILNYRIWAPTDDFFANPSALSALLAGQHFASPEAARQGLEQAILALDPCLPHLVELDHA